MLSGPGSGGGQDEGGSPGPIGLTLELEYEPGNLLFGIDVENTTYNELFLNSMVPFMVMLSAPSLGTLRVTVTGAGTSEYQTSGGFFSHSISVGTENRDSVDVLVEFVTPQGAVAAAAQKTEQIDKFEYKVESALLPIVPKLQELARDQIGDQIDEFFSNQFDEEFLTDVANEIANDDPTAPSPLILIPMLQEKLDAFKNEIKGDSLELADIAISEWSLAGRVEQDFNTGATNPEAEILKFDLNRVPAFVALKALADELDEYISISPHWDLTDVGKDVLRNPLKNYQDANSLDDIAENFAETLSMDVGVSLMEFANQDRSFVGTIEATILGVSFDRVQGIRADATLTFTPPEGMFLGPRLRGSIVNNTFWELNEVTGTPRKAYGTGVDLILSY